MRMSPVHKTGGEYFCAVIRLAVPYHHETGK